jgi:subtilisin family serine protease
VQYDDSDNYVDNHGHGTHVTGLIVYGHMQDKENTAPKWDDALCKQVKVFACKYYDVNDAGMDNLRRSNDCIDKATKWKMDYINYSGGGVAKSEAEYNAIMRFHKSGGVFVTVTGNEGSNLDFFPFYPASYKFGFKMYTKTLPGIPSIIMVEAIKRDGTVWSKSNTSKVALKELGYDVFSTLPNNQYGFMSGTSQAAPTALHTILKQRCDNLKSGFQLTSK